jgi:hypothetical protein
MSEGEEVKQRRRCSSQRSGDWWLSFGTAAAPERVLSTPQTEPWIDVGPARLPQNWSIDVHFQLADSAPRSCRPNGPKTRADLVIYVMAPAGTRLQSVPHIIYEPGQTYGGTTSGFVGGAYGSLRTYGSSPGSFHTQYTTEEVGRYTHVVGYLTKRR